MNIDAIETRALDLLDKSGCLEVPVPVKSVIKFLDIKLSPYDLGDDVSGVLVVNKGECKIGYNSTESLVRQRFTLAHEVGHFWLHLDNKEQELFVDDSKYMFRKQGGTKSQEYKKEMQANQFAAALLMPKCLIQKEIELLDNGIINDHDLIVALSKKFKVSQISMTYRLNNLGFLYA
ncbi:ImmA/IrrE family metallo-endopeptidase [Aestuariibaculum sp. M13]|uniref:ImmA/IrrE family metallo-endopeptidase n=1 Tax=Aestuariibaculum sp. M13 TaxID=2967132 RepID=UPI002159CD8B|nr:ImmA/IrrE family metallo-endopeptidase [Aestuariibaculum sp. M13]MCR8667297.1 ImmA/IrrE family metallo-endopeptidase [Aestuariibaculum sp. M13]